MTVLLDWDKMGFSLTPTKTMFVAQTGEDGQWNDGGLVPYGNISLSPAAGVLNYGQGVFEGMKARRMREGDVALFRPYENAKRFAEGTERLCMPVIPQDYFVNAIKSVVQSNKEYIAPYNKGSLYLRPCLWGTGPILGVGPAPEYTFLIYASPVGAYYKEGLKPIKVLVSDRYHRAAPFGTGHVKCIGNYAGTLQSLNEAKSLGFDGCVYLDAGHNKYIEEVGTANFFCVIDNMLLTPKLGSILPGVTRDSVIQLARHQLKMKVIEKDISVEEALGASECFCVGTAAVVTPIGSIGYLNQETIYNDFSVGPVTQKIYHALNNIQLGEAEDPFSWIEKIST